MAIWSADVLHALESPLQAQVVAFARTQVVAFREGDDKKDDDDDGDVADPSGGLADQRRYDW